MKAPTATTVMPTTTTALFSSPPPPSLHHHNIILLPWHFFLRWLSWCCGVAVRSTTSLGAPPPSGYISTHRAAHQLKELTSILDHMHAREDVYRRAIRELQEELDMKNGDRRKALKKLKITKDEIASLTEQLEHVQRAYELQEKDYIHTPSQYDNNNDQYQYRHSTIPSLYSSSSLQVHCTMILTALAVWWFSQGDNHAAVHWKLVFSLFFPLLWGYVSWMTSSSSSSSSWSSAEGLRAGGHPGGKGTRVPMVLLACAWFLIGFCVALTMGTRRG